MKTSPKVGGVKKALSVSQNGLANVSQGLSKTSIVRSVGVKLFLNIFISILVCVLCVGLFSYNQSKTIIQNKVADASRQTIAQTAGKLDLMFTNYETATMQIVVDQTIQEAVRELSLNQDLETYAHFSLIQKIDQRFQNFMNGNSKLLFGGALFPLVDYLNPVYGGSSQLNFEAAKTTDWYQKAIEAGGKLYWIPTQMNGLSGKMSMPSIGIARVIKSTQTNRPVFLLALEISLSQLQNQLGNINLGEDSQIHIVDDTNTIIFDSDLDEVGEPFDLELAATDTAASMRGNHDGEQVLAAYQQIMTGWNLVGLVPVNELVKDAAQIRNLTWIMSLVAALIAIGIGYIVVRVIATPLAQLRNLMNEGAKGNLAVRSSIRKKDEIGELAESFNQMMAQITSLVNQTNDSAQEVLQTAGELSDASRKTAASAKEIAVATEEIANGASSLAVEAERGSDLTENMGTRMQHVREAGSQMTASAAEVESASETGTRYMGELIEKTGMTEEMTRNMVDKVDKLKDSTRSIRKILDVLNNLTKQTNILSLNATIEAARAGAAGKGFMVVADEIRQLADQSRQSIDVVGQITETIQREIDDTVQVLSEAYPIFQEQIDSVKEANQIFLSVQSQMGHFVRHLDTVTASVGQLGETQNVLSEAMSNVSAVAQQSSATSEEVASLSNEQLNISDSLVQLSTKLEAVSNQLKESLSRFNTK